MICLKNFADRFQIVVKQVIIHKLVDGVFYSSIISERDGIEEIIDALNQWRHCIGTRFKAPIFTYKGILDKAGFTWKPSKGRKISKEEEEVIEQLLTGDDKESTKKITENYTKYTIKNYTKCWTRR